MQAGKLRKRMIIQTPTGAVDAFGEQTSTWITITTVWAEFLSSRGDEGEQSGRMEASISHQVRIRYQSALTLTTGMRLVNGSRYFDIVSIVDVEERGREWILGVKENV